jgi:hypothetical protein
MGEIGPKVSVRGRAAVGSVMSMHIPCVATESGVAAGVAVAKARDGARAVRAVGTLRDASEAGGRISVTCGE